MNELKAKALELINAWNAHDVDLLAQLYGEKIGFHDPLLGKVIKGEEVLEYAKSIYSAFPNLEFVIKNVAVGDQVVMVEWSQNGTNEGAIFGQAATGRYIEIPAVSVLSFQDDEVVLHQDYWDMKKLQKDLFG